MTQMVLPAQQVSCKYFFLIFLIFSKKKKKKKKKMDDDDDDTRRVECVCVYYFFVCSRQLFGKKEQSKMNISLRVSAQKIASRAGCRCLSDEAVPHFRILPTSYPTVYTCTPLDPQLVEFPMLSHQQSADLFGLPARYIHPKEFEYQLPTQGVPEFAFVGR